MQYQDRLKYRHRLEYQHRLPFQRLIQEAIRLVAGRLSDSQIISGAKLPRSKAYLGRFRRLQNLEEFYAKRQRLPLDYGVARLLWEFLEKEIDQIVRDNPALGAALYSGRDASDAMFSFYVCHKDQIEQLIKDGLEARYFCYKPSFRKPGYLVKSRMEIETDDHLQVTEYQVWAEWRDQDIKDVERSAGFAISKSKRLWMFLREMQEEQPRIFCFHKYTRSVHRDGLVMRHPTISRIYGNVLESDKLFVGGVFSYKVGLSSFNVDRALWVNKHGTLDGYDEEAQLGMIPFTPEARQKDKDETDIMLDPEIAQYLSEAVKDEADSRDLIEQV